MEHMQELAPGCNATDEFLKLHYLTRTVAELMALPSEQKLLAIRLLYRAEQESGRQVERLGAYKARARLTPGMKDDLRRHWNKRLRAQELLGPLMQL